MDFANLVNPFSVQPVLLSQDRLGAVLHELVGDTDSPH